MFEVRTDIIHAMSEKVPSSAAGEKDRVVAPETFNVRRLISDSFNSIKPEVDPNARGLIREDFSHPDHEAISGTANRMEDAVADGIIDLKGLNLIIASASEPLTRASFVKSMRIADSFISDVRRYRRFLPQYFPEDIMEEMRQLWGRVDSAEVHRKYVLERIPETERATLPERLSATIVPPQ